MSYPRLSKPVTNEAGFTSKSNLAWVNKYLYKIKEKTSKC